MTSQAFNEAIWSPDVYNATAVTRSLLREMRSGSARSPLLRTVLYDQCILQLLNRVFGEGVDPTATGRHLCWFDGASGARFEDFEELQAEGANVDHFSNAEKRMCAAASNLGELFNVSHVACTTPELRRALGLPAAVALAPGTVIPDSLFSDPGMERRTFLLLHDVLPQATRIILDATGGAAPVLRTPLAQELFSRTDPLLLVLQRHADATSGAQGIPMLTSLAARINPPKPRPGTKPGATGAFGAGGTGNLAGTGAGGATGAAPGTAGAAATGGAAGAAAGEDSSWRSDGGIFVSLPDLLVCFFVHFAVSATRRRIPKERFVPIRNASHGGNGGSGAGLFSSVQHAFGLGSDAATPTGGSTGGGVVGSPTAASAAGGGAGAGGEGRSLASSVSEDWEEASELWRRVSPSGVPHGPSDAFAYRTIRSFTRDSPYMNVLFAWFDAALPMTEPPAHALSETLLAAVSAYWLLHNPPLLLPLPGETRPPHPNPLGIFIGLPGEQPALGPAAGAGPGGLGGMGSPLALSNTGAAGGGLAGAMVRSRFGPAGALLGLDDPTDGLGRRAAANAAGTGTATRGVGGAGAPGATAGVAGRDTFPMVAEPRYQPPTVQQLQAVALLITLQQCDDGFHSIVSGVRPSGQGGRAFADLARDAVRALHGQPAKRASLGADPARLAYLCMLTGLAPPNGTPAAAALGMSGMGAMGGGAGLGASGVFGASMTAGGGAGIGQLIEVQGAAAAAGMGLGYGVGAGVAGGAGIAASDPMNLRRFTGKVAPSSLAALAASQRVTLMPQVWERLQHPLFTFLHIHMARVSPVTDPTTWAHIVDTWLMVLAPWRARNRYKAAAGSGIALFVPAPTARCFDYAGQAQGALGRLANRRTAAAAAGGGGAGGGSSFAAEEVAAELRAPAAGAAAAAAKQAAVAAQARGVEVGGVVTADRKFAASVSVGHDFERGHVLYSNWEEWRPWVAQHYAFYTYLLRAVVAAAASAALAAPHPSPVLEALERVLDVYEPCVVAELHRVREVVEATFEPRSQAREGALRRAAAAAAAATAAAAGAGAGAAVSRGAGARVVGTPAAAVASPAASGGAGAGAPLTPAAAYEEAVEALSATSSPEADATRLRLLAHLAALRLPPSVDPREVLIGTADWDVQEGLRRLCNALHAAAAAVPPPPTTEVLTRFVRPPPGTPGAFGGGYGSGGGGAGAADPLLGRLDSTKEDGAGGAGAGAGAGAVAGAAAPAAAAATGAPAFDLGTHIDSQPISPAVTAPLVLARGGGSGGAAQAFALDAVTGMRGGAGGNGSSSGSGGPVWLPSADRLQLLADRIAIAFGPVPPSPVERARQRQAAAAAAAGAGGGAVAGAGAGRAAAPPADTPWPGSLLSSEEAIRRAVAVCTNPAYAGVALPMRVPRQLMGAGPAAAGALVRRPRGLLTALTACCSSAERRRYCAGALLSCIRRLTGLRLAPAPPLRSPYMPLRDTDVLQDALLSAAAAANAAAAGGRAGAGAGAAAAAAGAGADGAAAALRRARTDEERLQRLAQGLVAPHSLPLEAGLLTAQGRADLLRGSALMFSKDVRVNLPEQLRPVGSNEIAWLVEATRRINARLLWGLSRLTGLHFTATKEQVDEALRALRAGVAPAPAGAPADATGLLQRSGCAELVLQSQMQPRNYLRPLADQRIAVVALLAFAALNLRFFGVSPALFAALSVYMLTFFLMSW